MTVPLPSVFQRKTLAPGGIRINTLAGGRGSPVLLLHGYPQTHVMWHHVAPILAEHHTVVLTDLRGYGDSGKPAGGASHEAYAKRTMARDQVLVMRELGFDASAARGEKVTAPLLALWGEHGFVGRHYRDVLAIWREYAVKADGRPLPCGHYVPEEVPLETAAALLEFLQEFLSERLRPSPARPRSSNPE